MQVHETRDLRQYGAVGATAFVQSKFDKRRPASPEWIVPERPSVLQVFHGDAGPQPGAVSRT
jgi:hypothetical protein